MVAYAIGRKVGGAVQRNQLRRRLRAAVADQAHAMRPGAYLVSATAGAKALSFGELRALLTRAVEAVAEPGPDGP